MNSVTSPDGLAGSIAGNGARRALDPAIRKGIGRAESHAAPPRALLVATEKWATTALLAHSMAEAGFSVAAHCPLRHPLRSLRALRFAKTYFHPARFAQLDRIIARWKPDILVPCDDNAVALLHDIHAQYRDSNRLESRWKAALIAESIGGMDDSDSVREKSKLIALAGRLGIAIPKSRVVESEDALRRWIAEHGSAAFVLKRDGTWGGQGVKIAAGEDEAIRAHRALSAPTPWSTALEAAMSANLVPICQRLRASKPNIAVQEYIGGRDANRAVVCWKGEVLAGITLEVIHAMPDHGPATVVRAIRDRQIEDTARHLVSHLRLSGFIGFDFRIDETSGRALLLEMNARSTPASYLSEATRHSLAAALFSARAGIISPAREDIAAAGRQFVLFPQEMQRDWHSPYLRSADHKVPWDEPEIVSRCLRDIRRGRRLRLPFTAQGERAEPHPSSVDAIA